MLNSNKQRRVEGSQKATSGLERSDLLCRAIERGDVKVDTVNGVTLLDVSHLFTKKPEQAVKLLGGPKMSPFEARMMMNTTAERINEQILR